MSSLQQLLSDIELMYEHKEAYKRLAIKYKATLEEIINIPPCTCGDREQGFNCMCGRYNADEIARKALKPGKVYNEETNDEK